AFVREPRFSRNIDVRGRARSSRQQGPDLLALQDQGRAVPGGAEPPARAVLHRFRGRSWSSRRARADKEAGRILSIVRARQRQFGALLSCADAARPAFFGGSERAGPEAVFRLQEHAGGADRARATEGVVQRALLSGGRRRVLALGAQRNTHRASLRRQQSIGSGCRGGDGERMALW